MTDLEELNRAVGKLEGKTDTLVHNQDRLIASVENLSKTLKHKAWRDSAKMVSGAFAGGFTAVFVKLGIWGS